MNAAVSRTIVVALGAALVLAGCGNDSPTGTAADKCESPLGTVLAERTAGDRWNALTRAIVARREFGPLGLARTFSLVSVAQYNAIVAADKARERGERASVAGAAAGAGAAVLASIYPTEQPAVDAQLAAEMARTAALPAECAGVYVAGVTIGRNAGAAIVARAATDRSNAMWTGTVPTGPGTWVSAPAPAVPLSPLWGQVKPWLMTSGNQFRPTAPPAFGSAAYQTALTEVRRFSDTRTPEQLRIAQFWGAVTGTAGPPGYWSEVGLDLAARQNLDERATARLLAMMHMAGMDASIGCWDAKYAYWYIRPYQADPAITTPVGRPNFPSYPSAHSCLSAAFAGVLAGIFPSAAADLRSKVEEAGVSRIYAGLHFRFDVAAGQELGYAVAALALQKMPREGVE